MNIIKGFNIDSVGQMEGNTAHNWKVGIILSKFPATSILPTKTRDDIIVDAVKHYKRTGELTKHYTKRYRLVEEK